MINLSLDKLRLIVQIRNISDYKNKSKEDLIKALIELETPKLERSKSQTPKSEKLKPEIGVNTKKLKKLRRDFDELRHKFSRKRN